MAKTGRAGRTFSFVKDQVEFEHIETNSVDTIHIRCYTCDRKMLSWQTFAIFITAPLVAINVLRYRGGFRSPDTNDGNEGDAKVSSKRVWNTIVFIVIQCALAAFCLFIFYQTFETDVANFADKTLKDEKSCTVPTDLIGAYGDMTTQYHIDIDTKSLECNTLFDQGMMHLFGFNRLEAKRNFKESISRDPSCIFCHIGVVLANGPTINNEVTQENMEEGRKVLTLSWELLEKKQDILEPKHRSLLNEMLKALDLRFAKSVGEWKSLGQQHFDVQYRDEMKKVFEMFPWSDDVCALYADAVLNVSPWRYFESSRQLSALLPSVEPAYTTLQLVMGRNTRHPLALHLLIHITEQSRLEAHAGEAAADALFALTRGQGAAHLVHMPAHTYLRVGRYDDAVEASTLSIALDDLYLVRCLEPYVPGHNKALLGAAAMMSGRAALALQHVSQPAWTMDSNTAVYLAALFPVCPEFVLARFGRWRDMLALGQGDELGKKGTENLASIPSPALPPAFNQAVHHYGRALAHVRLGRRREAEASLRALATAAAAVPRPTLPTEHVFYPYQPEVVALMNFTAHASAALALGHWDEAEALLERAAAVQDSFSYMEPENFYLPIRQCLGAALLLRHGAEVDSESPGMHEEAQGSGVSRELNAAAAATAREGQRDMLLDRAVEAYVLDLREHPRNGWSLKGLSVALARGRERETPAIVQAWLAEGRGWRGRRDGEATRSEAAARMVDREYLLEWRKADHPIEGSCCEIGAC